MAFNFGGNMATLSDLEQGVNQASKNLQDWQASRKNPVDLLNEATSALGIPEVRTRVSSLRKSLLDTENLLSGVEGSVKGRTQGSLVTEAQRQRLTALEREPIAGQLGKFQGAYGMETGNLNDLMGEASQQVTLGIEGQKMQGEKFQTELDRSKGSYERALELEKMRRQKEEADRAHALAVKEANRKAAEGATTKKGTAMSLGDSVKDLVMSQGLTWGRAAALIEGKDGKKITAGSDADVYLKFYFGLREQNPGKYMSSADLQKAAKLGLTKG